MRLIRSSLNLKCTLVTPTTLLMYSSISRVMVTDFESNISGFSSTLTAANMEPSPSSEDAPASSSSSDESFHFPSFFPAEEDDACAAALVGEARRPDLNDEEAEEERSAGRSRSSQLKGS